MKTFIILLLVTSAHAGISHAEKLQRENPREYVLQVGNNPKAYLIQGVNWDKVCRDVKHIDRDMFQAALDLHNRVNKIPDIQLEELCNP